MSETTETTEPTETPPETPTTPTEPAKSSTGEGADTPPQATPSPEAGQKDGAPKGTISTAPVTFDLKLPEDSLLDNEAKDEIVAIARDQGMSPETAQQFLDREHQAVVDFKEGQVADLAEQTAGWEKEVRDHPTLGGENFEESASLAKRVFDKFGTPELRSFLESSGLGNKKEVVEFAVAIGKAGGNDLFIHASHEAGGEPLEGADLLYPKTRGES